jgi:NTE family protein
VLTRLRDARLYAIGAEAEFRALKPGSKQDASWAFLQEMRALGHRAGAAWLAEHGGAVGVRASVDLERFAGPLLRPLAAAVPA